MSEELNEGNENTGGAPVENGGGGAPAAGGAAASRADGVSAGKPAFQGLLAGCRTDAVPAGGEGRDCFIPSFGLRI